VDGRFVGDRRLGRLIVVLAQGESGDASKAEHRCGGGDSGLQSGHVVSSSKLGVGPSCEVVGQAEARTG
jgi:hypothetical protein